MYLYVAPWEWRTSDPGDILWANPSPSGVGSLDLRSLPQQGVAGGTPRGLGCFVTRQPDQNLDIPLGDGLDAHVTMSVRRAVETVLDLPVGAVASDTPLDVLWELLTVHADPTGRARWKPLMPTVEGNLELRWGGFSLVRRERYDPARHPLPVEVNREDYRRIRQETMEGLIVNRDEEFHLQYLQMLTEKYQRVGLRAEDLVPRDLPFEGTRPHRTTLTEEWNCADSSAINCDQTWTETTDKFEIKSNKLDTDANGYGKARLESDLASADHDAIVASMHLTSASAGRDNRAATLVRYHGSDDTFYWGRIKAKNSNDADILKTVTGTATVIGTSADGGLSQPATWKHTTEINGSTLRLLIDDVEKRSGTDTAITSNTRTGVYGGAGDRTTHFNADGLTAADLAAAATRRVFAVT